MSARYSTFSADTVLLELARRGVNLVDLTVSRQKQSSKRALFGKDKTLISGMADFAHLNDYNLLENVKL